MKKKILLAQLAVILSILPTFVNAAPVKLNGIYYNLNTSSRTAEVTNSHGGDDDCEGNLVGYSGAVNIPSSITYDGKSYRVTSIGYCAFNESENLTSITIPNSVTSIGKEAFYGCSGLTSITIPNSVTTIKDEAFEFCTGLTSFTIPNSVTSIGKDAFYSCSGLTSITIPKSVTSIGGSLFGYCSSLTSVTVAAGNTKYDSRDNCNAIVETSSNTLISSCNNTVIPNSVTSIGNLAFFGRSDLTSVTIPISVTSIGNGAFGKCTSLTSVTIPQNVTSIGIYAFSDCQSLTKIKVERATPISINSNVFDNSNIIYNHVVLYVPKDSKSSYASAGYWGEFQTIKEFPDCDVNVDGATNVVDVVDVARFVVGTPRTAFEEFLADMNGDRSVTVADAVVLVNEIAGDTQFAKPAFAPRKPASDVLTLFGDGSNLSLHIEGNGDYTAFQFDLWLPTDMDMMQMSLNDARRQGHQLLYNKIGDGHYRVVVLSTSGNVFSGTSGELLCMTLDDFTTEDICIDNIHFVTARGIDVPFEAIGVNCGNDGLTTEIHSVDSNNTIIQPVYNLNGQRLTAPRKGLNIIGGKIIVVK